MTISEFIDIYQAQLSEAPTCYLAYLDAESIHLESTGFRRFKSYKNFKSEKSRYLSRVKMEVLITKQRQVFAQLLKAYVPEAERQRWERDWAKISDS